VSCGEYVNRCVTAARQLEKEGISCEVIDLRTIVPLDTETILASIRKTGRVLVVHEAHPMCGVGAEIAAMVMEEGFDELDAPVGRLHPDPVIQPFTPSLENAIVVTVEKIAAAAKSVLAGKPPVPRRSKTTGMLEQPATLKLAETDGHADGAPTKPRSANSALVELNEIVAEVETAKAVVSVESPASGTLPQILAGQGTVIQMSQPLGTIQAA
jgi:biotin carboxyl carrier protein